MCCVLATLQGRLECVEGISLLGLPLAVRASELRMPLLRILILDGVDMEAGAYIDAPQLAMLSWHGGKWAAMPLSLDGIPQLAVLDLQHCSNLETLPDNLQARAACRNTCFDAAHEVLSCASCMTAVWSMLLQCLHILLLSSCCLHLPSASLC